MEGRGYGGREGDSLEKCTHVGANAQRKGRTQERVDGRIVLEWQPDRQEANLPRKGGGVQGAGS